MWIILSTIMILKTDKWFLKTDQWFLKTDQWFWRQINDFEDRKWFEDKNTEDDLRCMNKKNERNDNS